MAAAKKDVVDETTGTVIAAGVSEAQAAKIAKSMPSSHTVKVKAAADAPESTG